MPDLHRQNIATHMHSKAVKSQPKNLMYNAQYVLIGINKVIKIIKFISTLWRFSNGSKETSVKSKQFR